MAGWPTSPPPVFSRLRRRKTEAVKARRGDELEATLLPLLFLAVVYPYSSSAGGGDSLAREKEEGSYGGWYGGWQDIAFHSAAAASAAATV